MAAESLSELYLRLGLNYDDLQSDFISAEHTVQTNMGRLARENTSIRLQMEIDLSGLDEATDAQRIFEIRQRALNQQIANQRDRLNLANAALANARDRTGEYSNQTQRARIALEREQLALQHLEEELSRLNETQNESSGNVGNFLDGFQNIAGRAAPYVAGITAIAGALQTAADASVELIEKFRELQKQAYDLNMPFDKAKNFLRQIKLGGGDYGDFEGYMRGITDALVKGEVDDPEFIALSKYGAKITDATGRLKDFQAITEEVYQAWKKADAEGQGIEFLQLTGGESGIRDAIQFFKRYEEAKEDAAKIFDSGINPDELHQAERSLNLLTEQTGEFKDALADILTPAAKVAMDSLFEFFRDSTKFIVENKDELQRWGLIAAETFDTVVNSAQALNENDKFQNFKSAFDFVGENILPGGIVKNLIGDAAQNVFGDTWAGIVERANQKQIEYNQTVSQSAEELAKFENEIENTGDVLSQYGIQRVKEFKDELENLNIELDFGNSEYDKGIAETDLWLQRELTDKLYVSLEEELAIRELYAAKIEQIEREKEERVEEIREQVAQSRRTDLENALVEIEEEKQKRIDAGMEAAEAIRIAAEEKAAAIKDLEDKWAEHVNSIYQTSLENRLAQIDEEKQAWIQKGIDEVKATQDAEQQKVDARRNAAMEIIKRQLEEFQIYQQGGYKALKAYKLHDLIETTGVDPNLLNSLTPQQVEEFQKAQLTAERSLLPNFMTEQDKAYEMGLWQGQQISELQSSELERILGSMSINGETPNIDISAGLNEGLTVFSTNIGTASDGLFDLSQPILDVTEKLQDLSGIVYELSNIPSNQNNNQSNTTSPTVNVTVQIEEAHAWDTEHIQELADKVADQIEPAIINAIGGDSNSY